VSRQIRDANWEYGELSARVYELDKPAGRSLHGDVEFYSEALAGLDGEVLERCDRICVHNRRQAKQINNVMPGTDAAKEHEEGWWKDAARSYPDLGDLLAGTAPGRRSETEITCFANNVGTGLQFAAAGAAVLEKARQMKLGTELPDDWFSENVHP
jgi:ornithine cyclodeaminase/alanine dehydrogenase-like protein (mu-crystallin family)